jgi:hypothetical protein
MTLQLMHFTQLFLVCLAGATSTCTLCIHTYIMLSFMYI